MSSDNEMYVAKEGFCYVLRQVRFKHLLAAGVEHPHDACAYARNMPEMREMVDHLQENIDYSAVEPSKGESSEGNE